MDVERFEANVERISAIVGEVIFNEQMLCKRLNEWNIYQQPSEYAEWLH